jgi:hypothetical protein
MLINLDSSTKGTFTRKRKRETSQIMVLILSIFLVGNPGGGREGGYKKAHHTFKHK